MQSVTGKEFEALVLFRAQRMEEQKLLTMGRYGVQAVMIADPVTRVPAWQVIPSLPDFEGVIYGTGRQLIIEAKSCSQASYPIHQAGKKHPKQFDHMLRRAEFGALCYLLLHFNPRALKTKSDPAATYAIRVHPDMHFWREYEAAERISLDRADAALNGEVVPWNLYSARASKLTPDISKLIP
jgi:penicillin-binding protein-related factor A (putative recombinase)